MEITILSVLYVFAAVTLIEIIWVFYIKQINLSMANRAGWIAVAMQLLGAVVIIAWTSNQWFLIPACVGAYVGTYCAIKLHDYLERKNKK
jgi:hypothetical protein